jgi:cytochrome c553
MQLPLVTASNRIRQLRPPPIPKKDPMSRCLLKTLLSAALACGVHAAAAQEKQAKKEQKQAEQTGQQAGQGLQNAVAMCIGCHGIPGYKTAFPDVYHVPKIAGQQPGYIVNALKAYKSGERSHPSMRGIAASLSEQDMAEIAAYYGGPGK